MLNKLLITDLSTAESYAHGHKTEYNLWISIVDEEDKKRIQKMKKSLTIKGANHFNQFFYDWSDEDQDPFIQKHISTKGPQKQHIQNIISFLQPYLSDENPHNLAIHCFAGISRSSAIALLALYLSGKKPEEALEEVLKLRPYAWPNLRILRLASEILEADLAQCVKQWKGKELLCVTPFSIPNP